MKDFFEKKPVRLCACVVLFLAFLLILMPNLTTHGYWFTDEADNALAGMTVADGGLIYVDYPSQHMPLLYYVCGLFHLLGACSMVRYRLMFYVLLAGMWTGFFIRCRKQTGMVTALAVPVLYFFNMYAEYASFVLSEHFQAWGMAVLFFEFRRFYKERKIGLAETVWIGLAIFVSFGSAFVSAFPIAVIVVGVLLLEVTESFRKKEGAGRFGLSLLRKYAPVAGVCLGLFLLLFLPHILTGHLYDAYYGAYYVNRAYYSAYQSGYGASVLSGFAAPFVQYFKTFFDVAKVFYTGGDLFRIFLCYGINAVYFIWNRKEKPGLLLTEFCFMILCGSRGFGYDFHTLPYLAVTVCQLAVMLGDMQRLLQKKGRSLLPIKVFAGGLLVILLALFSYPYVFSLRANNGFSGRFHTQDTADTKEGDSARAIAALTEDGEPVILASINMYLLVYADRLPTASVTGVPWMYDAYKEETLEALYEQMPRVAVYDAEYEIWGYPISEYAPEFTDFMKENYVLLDEEYQDLYVRSDYYKEARARLGYQVRE